MKALTETCAALGRHCGPEAMMWGCDLDPGNLGALGSQLSVPQGAQPGTAVLLSVSIFPAEGVDGYLRRTLFDISGVCQQPTA